MKLVLAFLISVLFSSSALSIEIRNATNVTVAFTSGGVIDAAPSTHDPRYFYSVRNWTLVKPGQTFRTSDSHIAALMVSGTKVAQIRPPGSNLQGIAMGARVDQMQFNCSVRQTGATRDEAERLEAFRRSGCQVEVFMFTAESYKSQLFNGYEIARGSDGPAINKLKAQMPYGGVRFFLRNNSDRETTFQVRYQNRQGRNFTIDRSQTVGQGQTKSFYADQSGGYAAIRDGKLMVGVKGRDFDGEVRTWGLDGETILGGSQFNQRTSFDEGRRWFQDFYISVD